MDANQQPIKTCWVLDDTWTGYPRRFWAEGLNETGYRVQWMFTASEFVDQINNAKARHADDVALIDLSLDEPMPSSICAYDQCVKQALARRGTPSPYHGQAVGLWLWDQRQSLRLPYAYVSSHPFMFIPELCMVPSDLELHGMANGANANGSDWVFNRGQEGPIGDLLKRIVEHWQREGWLN